MVSAQWNTDADGPEKREARQPAGRAAPADVRAGGVVHRGQGKWYPGEPLPRWNIALQWRTDGAPLWKDPALLADPWSEADGPGRAPPAARRRWPAG